MKNIGVFLVIVFAACSNPTQKKASINSQPEGPGIPFDSLLDKLQKSTMFFIDKQITSLSDTAFDRFKYTELRKVLNYRIEEDGIRHTFFQVLDSSRLDGESIKFNDALLIETTNNGEVFSATNYLFWKNGASCRFIKYEMEYGIWKSSSTTSCDLNFDLFFDKLHDRGVCDFGVYDAFIASRIKDSEVHSEVFFGVCENMFDYLK